MYNENLRCYKFASKVENFWAIIACDDDFLAKEMFKKEYGFSDKKYENQISMEKVTNYSQKVNCALFPNPISVGVLMSKIIRFMPKVVVDSYDYMDADYELKSGTV